MVWSAVAAEVVPAEMPQEAREEARAGGQVRAVADKPRAAQGPVDLAGTVAEEHRE